MAEPKKIEEMTEVVPTKGRWKGKTIVRRVVSWEVNGKRYRTRKEAMAAQ